MMYRIIFFFVIYFSSLQIIFAQSRINWTADGLAYTEFKDGNIVRVDPVAGIETIVVKKEQLTPPGATAILPQSFKYTGDFNKMLLFTNTVKVWRYKTRGDYWVLDLSNNQLKKLGKGLPEQSLMFAKFSPNGRNVAYVSQHNIYTEDISSGQIRKLTSDGSRKMINGTFDWVYEEEFGCRDGFRWSPEGNHIAFWQVDANKIRDYNMLNTTDSVYSKVIPVEYPKVGEAPSPVRIGVIALSNGFIRWMNIDGDPQQHYIPRMEWSANNELIVQQLDRKQQESKLIYCNTTDGACRTFWAENDDAWVDLNTSDPAGWNWINKGQEFLWVSEKDGWRHIYKISRDGKTVTLLTKGNYDISQIKAIDEKNNHIYFTASPGNATQMYLYRVKLFADKYSIIDDVKQRISKKQVADPELLSEISLKGTHQYSISPNAKIASHSFSNYNTPPLKEWIVLPDNKPVSATKSIASNIKTDNEISVEYLQIKTGDNILLDAWINKPKDFDPQKKYPVVLYVYGEPATTTTDDVYGNHTNFLYAGDMSADGYIQVSIDNRGTPALKGSAWRKSIYRRIGDINIRDIAMGFKKILQNPFVDKERVAVWGWSGGGASTLNLMFMYPEIFKTGIAISAVTNQLNYDNIYQERYMGLPQENRDDFIRNSPISRVQGLKGNLLYIHGTGDDNVHYSNAEQLVNELVKYKKQFQFMAYPNRSHSISEGEGTSEHLSALYTKYLKEHCPPGGK